MKSRSTNNYDILYHCTFFLWSIQLKRCSISLKKGRNETCVFHILKKANVWLDEGEKNMRCLRCQNEDPKYFYCDHGTWYCRKCIAFGRVDVGEVPTKVSLKRKKFACCYKLKYPLTPKQSVAVQQIMHYLEQKQDVLVYAACGAGKTELTMEPIQTYLRAGKKVCFAISRRQVVLEIRDRMQEAFPGLHVIAVCQGYTSITDGDLIICTMHQLYRYHQCFDLLIMDEIDAFPYRDNALLEAIAMDACIGEKLMLTATPDEKILEKVEQKEIAMVELFQRPHGYPLIEPTVYCMPVFFQALWLLKFLKEQKKQGIQTLVFLPTITMAEHWYRIVRCTHRCMVFTSKSKDKEAIIDEFHKKKYDFLLCTTILERGITIKGIYVVIVCADHPVFQEASLIQMIGRVGRNIEMPTGKGVFLCRHKTKDIKRCVRAIHMMNQKA